MKNKNIIEQFKQHRKVLQMSDVAHMTTLAGVSTRHVPREVASQPAAFTQLYRFQQP